MSITPNVNPGRVSEVAHRAQSVVNPANGRADPGWVRWSAESLEQHMIYRFANAGELDA